MLGIILVEADDWVMIPIELIAHSTKHTSPERTHTVYQKHFAA